jgi:crotonobetainyl-CoA:carnitine CoA-transferase CaiB-like acyl-CoA transferase
MPGPLDGVLVVSIEQAVAAPTLTLRMADAGARVIKVERAEGDFARGYDKSTQGLSSYFVWLNRRKESIVMDLAQPGDLALIKAMIAKADVFVQNLGPGAAGRLGLGAEALRRDHPALITVAVTGYGDEGPYAQRKAYDLLVQAESGLASVTGRAEGPGRVGISVVDIATGHAAYQATLEALIARGRSGQGQAISISMFDVIADWMNVPYLQTVYGGEQPARVGLAHPSIAPYGVFAASDGAVLISIQNNREWARLCAQVLDAPQMAADPRFVDNASRTANRPALDAAIAAKFASHTLAEMTERLLAADISFGALNDVEGLSRHPHTRKVSVATSEGPVDVIAPPYRLSGEQDGGVLPTLDQHGAALRAEFG